MIFAAAALVGVLASPTPPPEPNHVTIDLVQSALATSGSQWEKARGSSINAALRYEFQATPHARFANTFHWERLSSSYSFAPHPSAPWWFNYNEYDDELDAELGRPDYPLGVGVGYFRYNPVYDFTETYSLSGFGAGIDRWPNYYTFHSLYYSAWYYPNVRAPGAGAEAYGILRADIGVNIRPDLVSPWNMRIGFMSDTWFAKSAGASNSAFNGPYVGVSYWR